jgi:hypothetical protein
MLTVGFEDLTAVLLRIPIFLDVILCVGRVVLDV